MPRKKICSCGNIILQTEKCPCKKAQRRPKADIERNKDITNTRWKTLRQLILDRDGAHCKRCLIKYNEVRTEKLEIHHIKPRIKYPWLTYEATNCVTLCKQCNVELGIREQLDFGFKPEEQEDIGERYNL
ncbi:HNH endonuclease [Peribacillus simplex]|uniref:HNH endonuclease n=1 Tax=Peribacillus simplex TaxID=1478 RepID=UPI0024C0E9D6|nr:HNH endonuclease signature motif containing protein [Peribacillus simplex]WHX92015.1 HNH endonuclease signature motif containing protein [Peribacillus simplex]